MCKGSETGLGDTGEHLVRSGSRGVENSSSWWAEVLVGFSWGLVEPSCVHRTSCSLCFEMFIGLVEGPRSLCLHRSPGTGVRGSEPVKFPGRPDQV